jgi:hypothetical protein
VASIKLVVGAIFVPIFRRIAMKKYKPIDWSKCPESRTPIGNPNNCVVADILPDGKTEILFSSDDNGIYICKTEKKT